MTTDTAAPVDLGLAPTRTDPADTGYRLDPRDNFHEIDPIDRAINADWFWLRGEFEANRLDHVMDRWVVVVDRRIVDSGRDGYALVVKAAAEFGVEPNRVVMAYIAPDQLIG